MIINYKKIVFTLCFLVVLSTYFSKIYRSYIKISKLNLERENIKSQKEKIENDMKSYDEKIEKLKKDFYVEEIARNELKFVKPGEVIYKVIK